MKKEIEDVTIVGAGPAGIGAAMQLKRCGISPLLLEADEAGGLLRNANLVENYPGFPKGISGVGLVKLFIKQMERLSVTPTIEMVAGVSFEQDIFVIETDRQTHRSRRLVISSGTRPVTLSRVEFTAGSRAKIYSEVHPLLDLEGKEIAIIGAGDAAFDYALNLSKGNQVYILNRTQKIKSLPLLVQRAQRNPNICYFENTPVHRISEDNIGRLMVKSIQDEGTCEFSVDYVIAAIGRVPNIGYLSEDIRKRIEVLMSNGLLYMIGDVKNDIYRQTSIAVGDGVRAAMEIYLRVEGKE
jgi:thioredoxin reductase